MTFELQRLIRDASTILGSDACFQGKHDWVSEGGRPCPRDVNTTCCQTVYTCRTCGVTDYGNKGGPAHKECFIDCKLPSWVDNTLSIHDVDPRYELIPSFHPITGRSNFPMG